LNIHYHIKIEEPKTHIVKVSFTGKRRKNTHQIQVFMPSWTPGSYLMREYARHIRSFKVHNPSGQFINYQQIKKGVWEVTWEKNDHELTFTVEYEVYCHEMTVRTPHVDESHAYLHLPALLMGVVDESIEKPTLKLNFPPLWEKVTTGLKDVSPTREEFLYQAENYDELIDCPVEIGCHETDGFNFQGVDFYLAFRGENLPHGRNIKNDMKKIVETVCNFVGEIPFERYTFITHFIPGQYGGLEHANSTVLIFSGNKLAKNEDYFLWLSLVAHELFHAWNVKRIRPKELGPFDYLNEGYTRMLWLAEGLTSLMDNLFVLRSGLLGETEYLNIIKKDLNSYLFNPGRKFHSLEDSSFNAWVKLYRPDENTKNSSISYYLKGGIVFFCLNTLLVESGKKIDDLISLLWKSYKNRPDQGLEAAEVYQMVEDLAGRKTREKFELMISTTEEIDLEDYHKKAGLEFEWEYPEGGHLGVCAQFDGTRVFVQSVDLDGPAYSGGLNAGDEIIAINGMRFLKEHFEQITDSLIPDNAYDFTISRLNRLGHTKVLAGKRPRLLKNIKIVDQKKFDQTLK